LWFALKYLSSKQREIFHPRPQPEYGNTFDPNPIGANYCWICSRGVPRVVIRTTGVVVGIVALVLIRCGTRGTTRVVIQT